MKRPLLAVGLFTFAAALATLLYIRREIQLTRPLLAAERQRAAQQEEMLARLHRERDAAFAALTAAERALQTQSTPAGTTDSAQSEQVAAWLALLKKLRQAFADFPGQTIPELQFLLETTWLAEARQLPLDTALDLRKARARLRELGVQAFAQKSLGPALRAYAAAHKDERPAHLNELLPYFNPPIDSNLLGRYALLADNDTRSPHSPVIMERSLIDEEFDRQHVIFADGRVTGAPWGERLFTQAGFDAGRAYSAANNQRKPSTGADLLPYISDPVLKSVFTAIENFRQSHPGQLSNDYHEVIPLISDPAARTFLEKMSRAQRAQKSP
jgi:hypothetical protein